MATTATFALPYPNPADPADVPADLQRLAVKLTVRRYLYFRLLLQRVYRMVMLLWTLSVKYPHPKFQSVLQALLMTQSRQLKSPMEHS
jgi:hypothetical protein